MAKATKVDPVVETKVVEVEPGKVTLEMTPREAEGLCYVLGSIRGTGDLRVITNSIYHALREAGVNLDLDFETRLDAQLVKRTHSPFDDEGVMF